MKAPMHRLSLLTLLLAALPTQAVRAEENRLLPFWGQPYPSGYAWDYDRFDRDRFVPCRPESPYAPSRRRAASDVRCRVVLHARD